MKTVKLTNDKFVWHLLSVNKAKDFFKIGYPIFILYDDDSEALINNEEELNDALKNNYQIGMEVGFLPTINKEQDIIYYTVNDNNNENIIHKEKHIHTFSVNVYKVDNNCSLKLICSFMHNNKLNIEINIKSKIPTNSNYLVRL